MVAKACSVNLLLFSPVPGKPTTKPYPTNWLLRTPCTLAISLIRAASAVLTNSDRVKPKHAEKKQFAVPFDENSI